MSKIEIPAGTNPEILKPYRYKTDWGTRLFFHPELFGGATGKHFDIIDENGGLHENVFCEEHGHIRADYVYMVTESYRDSLRPKQPLIYGGPLGNAPK